MNFQTVLAGPNLAATKARATAILNLAGGALAIIGWTSEVPGIWGWLIAAGNVVVCAAGAAASWRTVAKESEMRDLLSAFGGIGLVCAVVVVDPRLVQLLSVAFLWSALFACVFTHGRTQAVEYAVIASGCIFCGVVSNSPEYTIVILVTVIVAVLFVGTLVAQLEEMTRVDPLTQIANRRAWDERLDLELSRAARMGSQLCVAIVDLDHFKAFNDSNGHAAGDAILAEAGDIWKRLMRREDLVARLGGEEFGVLLVTCDTPGAILSLERLRRVLPSGVTCSVGVAAWDGAESAPGLTARADAALYRAKATGRDRVVAAEVVTGQVLEMPIRGHVTTA